MIPGTPYSFTVKRPRGVEASYTARFAKETPDFLYFTTDELVLIRVEKDVLVSCEAA